MTPTENLKRLGITLPSASEARFSYVKVRRSVSLAFVAGHSPKKDGRYLHTGKLGADVTLEQGQACAEVCILNALASLQLALGSLDEVTGILKVVGYVASTPDFTDQPLVINAASDLLLEVFGDAGRHARSAVGVSVLPGDIPVEIEMVVEVRST